jgi:hypothetical protein
MSTLTVNLSDLEFIESRLPQGTPIVMLNLLRFRANATYPDSSFDVLEKVSGREAYLTRYLPAFDKIATPLGDSHPLWLGTVLSNVVGPGDLHWDDIALIQYETFALFRAVVESEAYARDADPHRIAGLEDWNLLALVPLEL